MIPIRAAFLFPVMLLASACDWKRTSQAVPAATGANVEADQASPASAQHAPQQNEQAPPSGAVVALPKEIERAEDILVNARSSCAMTLRYGDNSHEVTWPGPCGSMTFARMFSIDDLKIFEHPDNDEGEKEALEKARDYLPLMPNRRALYIEGGSTSVLYLEFNGRIDEVYLAD